MIELREFSKSYSSQRNASFAVQNFSFTCQNGEITALLGLNGAGKTTILKAIAARHFATSGTVLVDGVNASEHPEIVRNLTGFVQEEPQLPGEYTVSEYLNMVARLHGVKDFTLQTDLLSEILCKKIRTLSKGQRQRVNFAQSLLYNPPVLVLDECTSGLDPAQIIHVREFIKSLKAEHTILLSTHLMQEVEALCDKVCIIHEGKCVAFGSASHIALQYNCANLEEAFFKITSQKGSE